MFKDLKKRVEAKGVDGLIAVGSLIMGMLCLGIVGLIVYAQIYGCYNGCGG